MPLPLSSPTTVVSSRPLKYVSFSMMTWSSSSCLALSQLKDHFFRVAYFTERSPSSLPQQYSFNTSLYFYCFLNPLDSLKKLLSHSTVHFSLFWLHCGAYGVLVPWLRVKPVLPAMEVQSPNRWATRAFPCGCCWVTKSCLTLLLCGLALQAPLSVEFPRQKYWSRLPFPSSGGLPDPGMEPEFPVLQADFLPLSHQRRPGDALQVRLFYVFLIFHIRCMRARPSLVLFTTPSPPSGRDHGTS